MGEDSRRRRSEPHHFLQHEEQDDHIHTGKEDRVEEQNLSGKDHSGRAHHEVHHRVDTILWFKSHKNLTLEKARRTKERLSRPASTRDLLHELVIKIQVVALQVVALYGAESW